jgi:hypothetical protein
MSADTIAGELSENEQRVLTAVLDEIIPRSDDGRFPGAGEVGVAGHIAAALRTLPDLRSMILQGLADLEHLAYGRYGEDFAVLPRGTKLQLLNEQAFVLPLTLHAFVGYYQSERVVTALGLEARPPHPKGYAMPPNDLTMLDAVRRRPQLYREA